MCGDSLNEKRLQEQDQKLADLRRTVGLLEKTMARQAIGLDEAKGLLNVITDYAYDDKDCGGDNQVKVIKAGEMVLS